MDLKKLRDNSDAQADYMVDQNVGKRNAVFHLQCYAIEHRFQGAEYNSLISAFFVSASRLNQEEKGFYCVTIYPSQKGVSTKQLTKCDIQRLCISTAYVGFTYIGLSNVGKTYVGKSNAIK